MSGSPNVCLSWERPFIGTVIGLITYETIYALNPIQPRATTSWALSFGIGLARQHTLYRWLTFTDHCSYWPSLGRVFVMYCGSAAGSTLLNWVLTDGPGVHHRIAWVICLHGSYQPDISQALCFPYKDNPLVKAVKSAASLLFGSGSFRA